ncbi:MAG: alpha-galactosidase [Pseudomonadota bacterium]
MSLYTLRTDLTLFAVAADAGPPRLVHFGAALPDEALDDAPPAMLPAAPDKRVENRLFPLLGDGFFGEPALLAWREGAGHVFSFNLHSASHEDDTLSLDYRDAGAGLHLTLNFRIIADAGFAARAKLSNAGTTPLFVQRLNALTLPLPAWATTIDATFGGWSSEGHAVRLPLSAGKFARNSRTGKPGFDGGPTLILCEHDTNETNGRAIGVALAHSGNFEVAAERFADGGAQAYAAEWFVPGEKVLAPGESYETPEALFAYSDNGLSALSDAFHAIARAQAPQTRRDRPVQLNSWEAVYFNINEREAMRLADEAAAIGAERFVLDDGWFKGRTGPVAGLGDWTPDPAKFPNDLRPLAEYVRSKNMEFGLWIEAEMVNPDSDLYRAHPGWVLRTSDDAPPTGREQLVLDLTNADVRTYLETAIDKLLTDAPISYLKWDHNRDLYPDVSNGRAVASAQTAGFYALLDAVRTKHPDVSIESCASGGGRIDFGVLSRADRFWTSDATDPYDRARIQRRASHFFPPELLGAHVGPSPNHWTGRQTTMDFRCHTAFFGHFGVELDPRDLNDEDRKTLTGAIALYKEIRSVLVDGRHRRCDAHEPGLDVQYILSSDDQCALVRVLRLETPQRLQPEHVMIPGLPDSEWSVSEANFKQGQFTQLNVTETKALSARGMDFAPRQALSGRFFKLERTL